MLSVYNISRKMEEVWEDRGDETEKRPTIIKSATDLQRLKLEKLMKYPERPIIIPERIKERGVPAVPEFVRNVMGSSAGAGSGEFHVYRHLRRKEYARQKYMRERGERERLDTEYQNKLDENKRIAEERTAKKRAKRKKKIKTKKRKTVASKILSESEEECSSDSSSSEHENVVTNHEKSENDGDTVVKCQNEEEHIDNKTDGSREIQVLPEENIGDHDVSNCEDTHITETIEEKPIVDSNEYNNKVETDNE